MNQDFRTALSPADEVKNFKTGQVYEIISELGRGGSSIVYEVFRKDNPAKHYALKEYYPINEALTIRRAGCKLFLESETDSQGVAGKYSEREQRILNYLPHNTSKDGRYFIYKEESFEANGTHYVVTDLDNCQALAESKTKDDLQSLLYALTDVCKGLAALHHNGVYHLDISSRNILIPKNGCAKITDFGAAATKEELENNSLTYEDFVFTPAFSSMEVKRAAHKGMIQNINPSCDTYSVCAILFRYTVGRSFEPTEDLTNCVWEKDLHVKYHDKYTKSYINRLIGILRKGLSGQAFRYNSAEQLADELHALTNKVEKDKKLLHAINVGGFTLTAVASLVLAIILIALAITPVPELKLQSQLETIYYPGDDIVFEVALQDNTGSDGIHTDDPVKALTLSGFTASRDVTPTERNTYLVMLTDIVFEEDGEKSICFGNVYKSEWFGKQNKPFIYTFTGYTEEPRIVIAEPTFTKVNNNAGHTLTYSVEFDIPANQEAAISLSAEQIRLEGYDADINIERVSNDLYNVTFSNIKGAAGVCTFSINEGVCKLENGALSREIVAPPFEIVEQEISNYQIHMYLHVISQDLRDGGYILLEYGTYSGQESFSLLDESMIHLDGFAADVCFEHNSYILLDNLSLDKGKDPLIRADTGAYISKENGSRSSEVQCEPYKSFNDNAQPTVAMLQLGKDSRKVKAGGDLVIMAFGSDNASCFLNKTTDMFLTTGFSYDDCQISVMGLTIRVVYTNVNLLGGSDEKSCVILKSGTFKDLSGNESHQVELPFTINP